MVDGTFGIPSAPLAGFLILAEAMNGSEQVPLAVLAVILTVVVIGQFGIACVKEWKGRNNKASNPTMIAGHAKMCIEHHTRLAEVKTQISELKANVVEIKLELARLHKRITDAHSGLESS